MQVCVCVIFFLNICLNCFDLHLKLYILIFQLRFGTRDIKANEYESPLPTNDISQSVSSDLPLRSCFVSADDIVSFKRKRNFTVKKSLTLFSSCYR